MEVKLQHSECAFVPVMNRALSTRTFHNVLLPVSHSSSPLSRLLFYYEIHYTLPKLVPMRSRLHPVQFHLPRLWERVRNAVTKVALSTFRNPLLTLPKLEHVTGAPGVPPKSICSERTPLLGHPRMRYKGFSPFLSSH